ncbi:alpha/beta hydrolase [Actinoplanes sp. NPDC051475]|uniref:alpha/beta fold hydrolase n=1 Tax=Actinoplanes sp. NPDC051475 TaxID=3157225 RepID=UPI00344FF7BC
MFEGFALDHVDVGEVVLRVRHGGAGTPVLLLHGHPRTHVTWHRLAPLLAERHTVVCPDLRGYGQSSKPPTTHDHRTYSKRAMAEDAVRLMRSLGHDRFAVVGHDRGGYVAYRAALDHPDVVSHLAVLDIVPLGEALARCDARFASSWWHWFFLGQEGTEPERVINLDPETWYGAKGDNDRDTMGNDAWQDYRNAIGDPATVHAMCEDYRAGLTIDRAHDDADRHAGRRINCPVLALWATKDNLPELYGDVLSVWRGWADNVTGKPLESGHHLAEEAPAQLANELLQFFASGRPSS